VLKGTKTLQIEDGDTGGRGHPGGAPTGETHTARASSSLPGIHVPRSSGIG
jgi:hypothetical protein